MPTIYAENYVYIWAGRPLPTLAVDHKTYIGTNQPLPTLAVDRKNYTGSNRQLPCLQLNNVSVACVQCKYLGHDFSKKKVLRKG